MVPPRSATVVTALVVAVLLSLFCGQGSAGGEIVFMNEIHESTTVNVTCIAGRDAPVDLPVAHHASVTFATPSVSDLVLPICTASFTDGSGSPRDFTLYSFFRDRRRCEKRCVMAALPDALYSLVLWEHYRPHLYHPDNASGH